MSEFVYYWTVICFSISWIATSITLVSMTRFLHRSLREIEDRLGFLETQRIRREGVGR